VKGTWQTDPGSGGMGAAIAVVAVVIIGAAIAGPVVHAVAELARLLLIAAAVLAVLAVAGGVTALVLMRRRSARRAPYWATEARPARPVQARTAPRELPARPEVHQHLHFHGVTPEEVAAIIDQRGAHRRE